jgi:hypothetical protein
MKANEANHDVRIFVLFCHSFFLSIMNLRLDAEFGESHDRLFHGQADDVCVGAVDFCDDFGATTLRGIGAGFIQRSYFREIICDLRVGEPAKTNTRNGVKAADLPAICS